MKLLERLKSGRDSESDSEPYDRDPPGVLPGDSPLLRRHDPGPATTNMHATSAIAADSSIISEAAPSGAASEYGETRLRAEAAAALAADPGAALPVIGHMPLARQQFVLGSLIGIGVLGLVLTTAYSLYSTNRGASQVAGAGQALMQSQRLAKSMSQAVSGNDRAFPEVRESVDTLARNVRALRTGDGPVAAAPSSVQPLLDPLLPLVERAEKNAAAVIAQQKTLTQVGLSLRSINAASGQLLDDAEAVAALKLQQGAPTAEVAAAGQVVMLTQRIGKSANELTTLDGISDEAVFMLGKDLSTFKDLSSGLLEGSNEQRLSPARDPAVREKLNALLKQYDKMRESAAGILASVQGLKSAHAAERAMAADSEQLSVQLETIQQRLSETTGFTVTNLAALLVFAALTALGSLGLLRLFVRDQTQRAAILESQRLSAERQELEAKRVNDANQAAILRLMNELQTVAEGDLTQQATVTEDITGAIADSVNYTVEELRTLVSQVQGTAARVTETTEQVDLTSTELLAASHEQLREIRDTGEAVLQMAGRINEVSASAQQTAQVARQSLEAAESGLTAVQNTIGGMNSIREQIQETSKRIKRLGESSQEIGEITELISDITEQTNVLALNAAIQAASAGEAGRGFSVVAEEVQRLAERSADATRQIAALVKAIQTDTQDAVAAMERSTVGVVEGAKLSDAAGTALGDIDRVSRQLAELIGRISDQALGEAQQANVVASNIQHIFAVTEQTGEGTRSTAQMVRDLSRNAEELKASVSRFKIS